MHACSAVHAAAWPAFCIFSLGPFFLRAQSSLTTVGVARERQPEAGDDDPAALLGLGILFLGYSLRYCHSYLRCSFRLTLFLII